MSWKKFVGTILAVILPIVGKQLADWLAQDEE